MNTIFLTQQSTQQSSGKILRTKFKYPFDYFNSQLNLTPEVAGIRNLKDKHILISPIEQYTQLLNPDNSSLRTIGAQLFTYNTASTKPDKLYILERSSHDPSFNESRLDSGIELIKDDNYKLKATYSYTADNLVQISKPEGENIAYLWGYSPSQPIAEAVNARQNEILFDSFEGYTSWSPNLTGYENTIKHCGGLSGKIQKTTLGEIYCFSRKLALTPASPRKFKFSGWVYSDGPDAQIFLIMEQAGIPGYTGQDVILINSPSTTRKWVYLEKEYTVPSNITHISLRLDNNGEKNGGTNVWFDDLRLHPADAQMTTYTYDPLVGMTSKSDVNNIAIHYEYDGFNRLLYTKDDKGNVLQKYEYKYVQ